MSRPAEAASGKVGGTVISSEEKREVEKALKEIGNSSTSRPGSPRGTPPTTSNESFTTSGHKSIDRKTGVAQADEHYTWRQVYRLCEVEGYGHK